MDERVRFLARLLEVDMMAALCREFGISRKTGHKIYRYMHNSGPHIRVQEAMRGARSR
jgi:putative transposase